MSMRVNPGVVVWLVGVCLFGGAWAAAEQPFEVSKDGHQVAYLRPGPWDVGVGTVRDTRVPYGTQPDWVNTLRRQVGGLVVADINGDGLNDLVVGCYISQSFPPYDDWHNLIYYNIGGQLELSPRWISTDQVSTGDVQVGDINRNGHLDVFSANGGTAMSPSVIYFGGPQGPNPTPGWVSQEPQATWNNYALLFDIDDDGDLDVITANQGLSPLPYRPMHVFYNEGGNLSTTPGWSSAESSIQNWLVAADFDGDGWEDIAVSKWANFETGIYKNVEGTLQTTPIWTTGSTTTDKGVGWADVDHNGWPDLAVGRNPTTLYGNAFGVLTPIWTATLPFFGHNDLMFFDVNGDGWMDLVEVHFSNGQVHIYLNDEGTLSTTPSWTYDSPRVGTAVAFGDINGDGLPDLAFGNSGEPSIMVFYARPAVFGDLDGDGVVGFGDLNLLIACWAGPERPDPGCGAANFAAADLDGDGDVDLGDFALWQPEFAL